MCKVIQIKPFIERRKASREATKLLDEIELMALIAEQESEDLLERAQDFIEYLDDAS